ncbi:MAG: hypothetical protein P1U40_05120 [Coxiellaceae bacterium]|nr:hypothetical protein [Coxiellaceae bacterium]
MTTPSDVLAKLEEVSQQIAVISKHMGVTSAKCVPIHVNDASPREVYFQALLMQMKINKLYEEVSGRPVYALKIMPRKTLDIKPSDVYGLISRLENKLNSIINLLHIEFDLKPEFVSKDATPTNVFNRLNMLNSNLSQLLERKVLPKDIYQITTLSVYYAGEILSKIHVNHPMLTVDVDSSEGTNKNIYLLQLNLIDHLKILNNKLGKSMLSVNEKNCGGAVSPIGIQNLAYIILSQIMYIADVSGVNTANIDSYYPGKKYPLDVYKRNLLLLEQIKSLILHLGNQPPSMKKKQDG